MPGQIQAGPQDYFFLWKGCKALQWTAQGSGGTTLEALKKQLGVALNAVV